MPTRTLLVVGSLNYDLILRAERIPRGGETVVGAVFDESCGGKGANQAIAAARSLLILGRGDVGVAFAGMVGADLFGDRQIAQLVADGIDIRHLERLEDVRTGVSTVWVEASGENRILNAPGANLRADVAWSEGLPVEEACLVLLQNETPAATLAAIADRTERAGVPLLWDPAPFPPGARIPLRPAQCRLITPNEIEAAGLLGRPLGPDPLQDVDALAARGFAGVLLTRGAGGVVGRTPAGRLREPAPRAAAVDTTAAGDAFAGALAACLAAELDLPGAVRFAVRYATASVCMPGAQSSLPTELPDELPVG